MTGFYGRLPLDFNYSFGDLGDSVPPPQFITNLPQATEATTFEFHHRIDSAITWQTWLVHEARVFVFAVPIRETDVTKQLLLSLNLSYLKNITHFCLSQIKPEDVMALLFNAACYGSRYNSGGGPAWGRLAAWQSLAGLTDTDPTTPFETVGEVAQQSKWYQFVAGAKEYWRQVQFMGIATLRPDGKSLAILAATAVE
jgi:hypothetical protein